MPHYFFDDNRVRYDLHQTSGGKPFNWLFFPGGPGADSRYLHSLADLLPLPGNVWMVDMPGNGDNVRPEENLDFDTWFAIFPRVIERFPNPILVGHSFGGMFPLLFPQLERLLKGLVILNSTPKLWLDEAAEYASQFDLPNLTPQMSAFTERPSQETFDAALEACVPYYFPPTTLEKGRALFAQTPTAYQPAAWWQQKALEIQFSAKWVPEHLPTMIVCGKYDCICPPALFDEDKRFSRPNIYRHLIQDGGHLGWIDNPASAKAAFEAFIPKII